MLFRREELPAAVGSYDFFLGQAKYFAWPSLTFQLLAGTITHEDAHHALTLATSLGHLLLHLKYFSHYTMKSPGINRVAQDAKWYLQVVIRSCQFCQESSATMTAYVATMLTYGENEAEGYLRAHGDPTSPAVAPYTHFVLRAIKEFRKRRVPPKEWPGYFNFMSSLAMNVDIDRLMATMPSRSQFQSLCSSQTDSADGRFRLLFEQLNRLIQAGGPTSPVAEELKHEFYQDSRTRSSTMPRTIAAALASHLPDDELGKFEAKIIQIIQHHSSGFGSGTEVDTLFVASQPHRAATDKTYVFHMDDKLAGQADLVEIGIACRPENVMYGGININFFWITQPRVRGCYCMVHSCFASRGKDLLDGKTIVVYYSEDMEMGLNSVEPVMQLVKGRPIVYIFYGQIGKMVRWLNKRQGKLQFAAYDLERPPVRFIFFSESGAPGNGDLFVLPVAPLPNRFLADLLSDIPQVSLDVLIGSSQRRVALDRFVTWFVFAPVT